MSRYKVIPVPFYFGIEIDGEIEPVTETSYTDKKYLQREWKVILHNQFLN
jgi:hypothetical protein